MIRLYIVKTGTEEAIDSTAEDDNGIFHDTKVLFRLIIP